MFSSEIEILIANKDENNFVLPIVMITMIVVKVVDTIILIFDTASPVDIKAAASLRMGGFLIGGCRIRKYKLEDLFIYLPVCYVRRC